MEDRQIQDLRTDVQDVASMLAGVGVELEALNKLVRFYVEETTGHDPLLGSSYDLDDGEAGEVTRDLGRDLSFAASEATREAPLGTLVVPSWVNESKYPPPERSGEGNALGIVLIAAALASAVIVTAAFWLWALS
jgi:hypothetical protein